MTNETQLEEFREKLQLQLRDDYFDKLVNDDDPSAERYALIGTIKQAAERLLEIETGFLMEILADSDEGICPSCLIKDATDVANIKNVVSAFNNYLNTSNIMHH